LLHFSCAAHDDKKGIVAPFSRKHFWNALHFFSNETFRKCASHAQECALHGKYFALQKRFACFWQLIMTKKYHYFTLK
jgi:hypothetical protein